MRLRLRWCSLPPAFTMRSDDFKSTLIINSSFNTLERYYVLRRRPAGRWAMGEFQHLLMLTREDSVHPCARLPAHAGSTARAQVTLDPLTHKCSKPVHRLSILPRLGRGIRRGRLWGTRGCGGTFASAKHSALPPHARASVSAWPPRAAPSHCFAYLSATVCMLSPILVLSLCPPPPPSISLPLLHRAHIRGGRRGRDKDEAEHEG